MENPEFIASEWILELEKQVLKTYSEIITTSIQRNEHHKQSAEALEEAMQSAHRFTMDYLEQLNI